MRYLLILLFFGLVGGLSYAYIHSEKSLKAAEALQIAAGPAAITGVSSGGNTLKIFTASWCPPCKQMKASVYPHPDVAPYKQKMQWSFYDVDEVSSQQEAKRYRVRGVPTFIIEDASGQELARASGGMDPSSFVAFLNSGL